MEKENQIQQFDMDSHLRKLEEVRNDFPFLNNKAIGKFAYLDSGATSQKPIQVIDGVSDFVKYSYANPHRGSYKLSQMATSAFEETRFKVKKLINAGSPYDIVFTKNSTEAFNLLAYSYALDKLKKGDKIVITIAEHHANLVTWQYVSEKTGAELVYLYVDEDGSIRESELSKIDTNTKILSVNHVSNVSGFVNDVRKLSENAHRIGAKFFVDGSQAVPHFKVDVEEINPDAYVFTGHKMMAYGGVGVLCAKHELLENMKPFLYGGDMIEYVEEHNTTFNEVPYKFEAGTPALESVISLSLAIDYIKKVGYEFIERQDTLLIKYLLERLKELPYIKIIGSSDYTKRSGLVSFTFDGVHSHDVSSILDMNGVGVRSGHHCAQPYGRYCDANSSTRISVYLYNNFEEIDMAIDALKKVREVFK